jgi:hypothetical protein
MSETSATTARDPAGESAPKRIRLSHAMEGEEHVFASPDLAGFRIASRDLQQAFDAIEGMLGYLVGEAFGARQPYVLNLTYREFVQRRFSPRRDPDAPVDLFAARVRHARMHDPRADFVPEARRRREALRRPVATAAQ